MYAFLGNVLRDAASFAKTMSDQGYLPKVDLIKDPQEIFKSYGNPVNELSREFYAEATDRVLYAIKQRFNP